MFFKFYRVSTFGFQDIAKKPFPFLSAEFNSKLLPSRNEQIDGLARV